MISNLLIRKNIGNDDFDGLVIESIGDVGDGTFEDVEVEDGTAANPSITFVNDLDTGIYRIGTDNLGISCGGTKVVDVTTNIVDILNDLKIGGDVQVQAGVEANPSVTFFNDLDTGVYRIGVDNLGISCGGTKALDITSTNIEVTQDLGVKNGILEVGEGNITNPSIQLGTSSATGIYASNTLVNPVIHFKILNSSEFEFNTNYMICRSEIRNENGTNANPTYTFTDAVTTGMFRLNGTGDLGFTREGSTKCFMKTNSFEIWDPVQLVNGGSSFSPGYSFQSDTDTGIYRIGANNIGLSCGSKLVFDISQTNTEFITDQFIHKPGTVLSTTTDFKIQVGDGISSYTDLFLVDEVNVTSVVPFLAPISTASAPSYSFDGDTDTGLNSPTLNKLELVTGGTAKLTMDILSMTGTLPLRLADGSASSPSFSFSSDTDTGMYYNNPGSEPQLRFTVGGTSEFYINSNGIVNSNISNVHLSNFDTGSGAFQRLLISSGSSDVPDLVGLMILNEGNTGTAASVAGLTIGQNVSTRNSINSEFYYASSGSTSNELRWGTSGVSVRQWAFQADGTQHSASSTAWTLISDRRTKQQISSLDVNDCLDTINSLQLKQFKYKQKHREEYGLEDEFQIGVIADEVKTVPALTKAVKKFDQKYKGESVTQEFESVDYGLIYQHLIGAVQALSSKVDALQAEIDILKGN